MNDRPDFCSRLVLNRSRMPGAALLTNGSVIHNYPMYSSSRPAFLRWKLHMFQLLVAAVLVKPELKLIHVNDSCKETVKNA